MNTAIIKPSEKELNIDTETNIDAMREYAKRKGIPLEEVNEKDPAYLEFLEKLEEFEDECIVARIEEGRNTGDVSMEEIFAILDKR